MFFRVLFLVPRGVKAFLNRLGEKAVKARRADRDTVDDSHTR